MANGKQSLIEYVVALENKNDEKHGVEVHGLTSIQIIMYYYRLNLAKC